jgi:hypothetical protein
MRSLTTVTTINAEVAEPAENERHFSARSALIVVALILSLSVLTRPVRAATTHYGQVVFGGVAVPGATVTATLGEQKVVTSTDVQGVYTLADLDDGAWTIKIEMVGFSPISREVTVAAQTEPSTWELTLVPFEELTRTGKLVIDNSPKAGTGGGAGSAAATAKSAPASGTPAAQGFRRAGVNAAPAVPAANRNVPARPVDPPDPDTALGAADGFLINGSVNNGGASPFAQLRAFGNNRPGQRSLYNGGLGLLAGNSAWDARPYSFAGQRASKPSYNDIHLLGSFGGPLRIPGLVRNGANLFVGYQHTSDHNADTRSALVPTLAERSGDFSNARDGFGRPVQVVDPSTGRPFGGNVIPRDRISPQAAALLAYYPAPNVDAGGRYDFQTTVLSVTRQDNIQMRATQPVNTRNQLSGTFAFQRTTTDTTNLFGFEDSTELSGVDTAANWSHRFSQFISVRMRYQFTRLTNHATPYFADLRNVSGEAGIQGNNQDPQNWGPPSLTFSTGIAGLSDGLYSFSRNQTQGGSAEAFWSHGRHNLTFGGGLRRHHTDVNSQQDPRGAFSFTGSATGVDLADFLLGLPQTSTIAFGNADKYLRSYSSEAYVSDDWRVSPSLTVNAGVRWEYESPIRERFNRLVNLDVAAGFTAVAPVVAGSSVGPLTGRHYPDSLMQADRRGVQPRVGAAWRPVPGSSLVVRAGYGIYRNTSVYRSIATVLAQQPPLSTTFSVETSAANPLTLASGFIPVPGRASNTFAVDPDFHVGYAHNWQVSMQRDLPGSLNVMASYLGTAGRRLMQEFLPNTFPAGAPNPCAGGEVQAAGLANRSCPVGFVYLTSNGSSSRHAGQLQLRRRLRAGLSASVQYTLANAVDDAAAFSGANLSGASIAQDWQDLDAERGPSDFDQRHLITAQFEYTTGVGIAGGALLSGWKGTLYKGWTFTSQLSTGSGLPLTPVYLASVRGTGVTGTIRADLTGAGLGAPDGFYLNPAAYAAPAPGRWGTAGRNSATGPSQFSLNAGVSRTFPWGNRLNLDWRVDAANVLNRVIYSSINAVVGSPQFGLPTRANTMRKLQTSLRLRF